MAMLGSGDYRHRVFISYGTMNAVFSFIEATKVLQMQAVNKFMYHRGVERLQSKIKLRRPKLFFHDPLKHQGKHTIYVYDPFTKQPQKPITLPRDFTVEFLISIIHQVGDLLYVFKSGNPAPVFRLDLNETSRPIATKMVPLQRYAGLFAIAIYEEQLAILTGGCGKGSQAVSFFDLKGNRWSEKPELNDGRMNHSSCCLGNRVYVFGGQKQKKRQIVSSIESHEIGSD